MSKFSVKSILLGIGIGIVFMSVISMIYIAGNEPGRELTKEDVRKLAEKYELIQPTEIFDGTDETTSSDTAATQPSAPAAGTGAKETAGTVSANETTANETTANKTTANETTANETTTIQPTQEADAGKTADESSKEILIKIEYMATSEKIAKRLEKDGLVEKASEFVKFMRKNHLDDNIQVGEFYIPVGASFKEIAGIITKKDVAEIE